jgi:hypothetical protein
MRTVPPTIATTSRPAASLRTVLGPRSSARPSLGGDDGEVLAGEGVDDGLGDRAVAVTAQRRDGDLELGPGVHGAGGRDANQADHDREDAHASRIDRDGGGVADRV